jgi:amino acid adenylation domain-containing protein
MRVEDFLRDSARRLPGREALVAGGRRFTYAELDALTDRLAAGLAAAGLTRGDRAVVFMDNCWQAVVAIFAIMKAGGVFSPIHPTTKPDKLAYVIDNCRASALLTTGKLIGPAREAVERATAKPLLMAAEAAGALSFEAALDTAGAPPFPGIALDLSMLVYTSGSTGFPKGVMMTHQNVVFAATSISTYLGMSGDDVVMNVVPLSFDYGLYQALMCARVGATLVLEKSFAFPQAIFAKMRAERCTGLPLVPTMAAMILQMRDLGPETLPDLRYISNTAAALPPAHIMRLRQTFPQAELYSMYGLTECKRCTYLPPAELDRRPGSVGIAIPGTEAYVADENGAPVPHGEVGELHIRGPHVMKGYWEAEAATTKALGAGPFPWERVLRTGDLFRADEDGFLYFLGRKDDIIKTRGEKVAPKEVENALYALPGVREAAVVGVEDPILGAAIKAFVAAEPDAKLDAQSVIRHCAKLLEDFMVPKHVEFRAELPKSANGKIDRRALIAPLLEAAE